MGFLLVEIAILLLLAALFGAALMRWWLKRQFEDVTVEYSRLTTAESERSAALTAAHAAQSDAEKKLAALQGAHDGLRERLDAEAAWRAEVDRRLDALKPGDTSEVTARLKALDERIGALKPVDLDPALARLGELEKLFKSLRPNELNVVIARLDDLEQAVASIKPSDMDPLLAKLDALARRVERLAPTSASAPTSAPVATPLPSSGSPPPDRPWWRRSFAAVLRRRSSSSFVVRPRFGSGTTVSSTAPLRPWSLICARISQAAVGAGRSPAATASQSCSVSDC